MCACVGIREKTRVSVCDKIHRSSVICYLETASVTMEMECTDDGEREGETDAGEEARGRIEGMRRVDGEREDKGSDDSLSFFTASLSPSLSLPPFLSLPFSLPFSLPPSLSLSISFTCLFSVTFAVCFVMFEISLHMPTNTIWRQRDGEIAIERERWRDREMEREIERERNSRRRRTDMTEYD